LSPELERRFLDAARGDEGQRICSSDRPVEVEWEKRMVPRRRRGSRRLELEGSVWISVGGRALGGSERFGLLRAVAKLGSITHAAKAQGMSYRGAWTAIETMNALAGEALVERTVGGRGGGWTRLTARGQQLIDRFEKIDSAHRRFLDLLDDRSVDIDQPFSLLSVLNMKTSARNQYVGTVTALRSGAVNDEVELTLPTGQRIVAVLTQESAQSLGLRTKMTAIALVKASSVLVATDLEGAKLSARNQLHGKVSAVKPGAVNAEVIVDLGGGDSIAAIVTAASVKALGLVPGKQAVALFKATSVIIAVTA
jgi:molybdate transport system regulatory protein